MGGWLIFYNERVKMQNRSNLVATECEDTNMPLRSLTPTSANSGVAARKPLGYVGYYAPATV